MTVNELFGHFYGVFDTVFFVNEEKNKEISLGYSGDIIRARNLFLNYNVISWYVTSGLDYNKLLIVVEDIPDNIMEILQ